MTATMMVSFLSLACLLLWFAAVWVCWLLEINHNQYSGD